MLQNELFSKVLTGIITALATLIVCFVNNYYQSKRERVAREENHKEQIDAMQGMYLEKIGDIKTDYSTQIVGLNGQISAVADSVDKLSILTNHSFEIIKMEIKNLSEKQAAYNNLQARTYKLEKEIEVQGEKINILAKME